jgi:hypothetical protein
MFIARIEVHGNPDRGQDPHYMMEWNVRADSYEEMLKKVRDFQLEHNIGAGNWGDCKLYLNNKIVGYMSYNGRVWKHRLRSAVEAKETNEVDMTNFK